MSVPSVITIAYYSSGANFSGAAVVFRMAVKANGVISSPS